jgi:hypothetical protein
MMRLAEVIQVDLERRRLEGFVHETCLELAHGNG